MKNSFKYLINLVVTASPFVLLIWVAFTIGTNTHAEMVGTLGALAAMALVCVISALFYGRGFVYWRVNAGGCITYKRKEGKIVTTVTPRLVYLPTWQVLPWVGIVEQIVDPLS